MLKAEMSKIAQIQSQEILDSRGNPTLKTTLILEDGSIGQASVPSGASTGKYEAVELRDQDLTHFGGLGVLKAVENVNEKIKPLLLNFDVSNQEKIDQTLIDADGTENKANFGANAILSVSLAAAVAQANSEKIPLYQYLNSLTKLPLPKTVSEFPTPMFNLINGGKHGQGNLDFQEFLVIPEQTLSFEKSLEIGVTVFKELKVVLEDHREETSFGDEGGYTPNLLNQEALERILDAIKNKQPLIQNEVRLGLDIAANQIYKDNRYWIREFPDGLKKEEYISYLIKLKNQFDLFSIEDPLPEEDWDSWILVNQKFAPTLIIADDLVTTNEKRLAKCVKLKAASGVIIKPNQIGTLTETLKVITLAKEAKLKTIVSHRSGEVQDTFIADLAVGACANFIKAGAPSRGERVAKYNRLLEIERELNYGR